MRCMVDNQWLLSGDSIVIGALGLFVAMVLGFCTGMAMKRNNGK